MTLRESDLGLSRVLARAAGSTADSGCSEAENEVIGLFDEYRSRLLRYVLSMGLTVHHAEEIVQEVFLALFRHLRLGRPKDNLRGWIFRVAHNLALKERMSEQSRPDRAVLDETLAAARVDPEPNPEQYFALRQRHTHLLAAVRALPERDQYCLHLRAEGLRYREIAQVLGMSLGAVSISLSRSLAKLERADRG